MAQDQTPSGTDFVAGALLANGLVYMWNFAAGWAPILDPLTVPAYVLCGAVPASFVCRKATSRHLLVGVKTAVFSWIVTVILMLGMAAEVTPYQAGVLFASFMAGGVGAAYISLRARIRGAARETSPPRG